MAQQAGSSPSLWTDAHLSSSWPPRPMTAEDKIDEMRVCLPGKSSDQLRKLLNDANGDMAEAIRLGQPAPKQSVVDEVSNPAVDPELDLVGKRVQISGLKSRPELNDGYGRVLDYDTANGRYTVQTEMEIPASITIALKRANFTVVPERSSSRSKPARVPKPSPASTTATPAAKGKPAAEAAASGAAQVEAEGAIEDIATPGVMAEGEQDSPAAKLAGSALTEARTAKARGNTHFQAREYDAAIECYTMAIDMAPDDAHEERAVFFCNRAACFAKLGEHEGVLDDCSSALDLSPEYTKALMRRAMAHEAMDHPSEALEDAKRAAALEPSNKEYAAAVKRLEVVSAAKLEQQKEEMLGKLKDLGNTVLGKFGMSLDNFKAEKDPNTGSYNISFNK